MKSLIVGFLLLSLMVGCDSQNQNAMTYPAPKKEYPTANLPRKLWQPNWTNTGSCVFAATCDILRWQGQFKKAKRIRNNYGGGATLGRICSVLDHEKVRYAYTNRPDVAFLERACETRRGCIVTINVGKGSYHYTTADMGYHCVALVHLDDEWAGIIDNNIHDRVVWMKREKFLSYWRASPGWALAPVYTPTSPRIPR